jgi:hypothetical protein
MIEQLHAQDASADVDTDSLDDAQLDEVSGGAVIPTQVSVPDRA